MGSIPNPDGDVGKFDQPVVNASWSNALRCLAVLFGFIKPVHGVMWPAPLRWLLFPKLFRNLIGGMMCPPLLEVYIGSARRTTGAIDHPQWTSVMGKGCTRSMNLASFSV